MKEKQTIEGNRREIKFRAWGEWSDNDKPYMNYNLAFEEYLPINTLLSSVESLMQYTGLKDRNGKEIYEGDILKDDVNDLLEVKFGKLPLDKSGDCVCTYLSFYCKNYGNIGQFPTYSCQEIGNWMYVVGNIYENPELLNK